MHNSANFLTIPHFNSILDFVAKHEKMAILVVALLVLIVVSLAVKKWATKAPQIQLIQDVLKIPEFDVYYRQVGAGPDVLLIHGIGASHYCWRLLVPLLQHEFRLTIIDLPGFGQSSKVISAKYDLDNQGRRLMEIIEALGLKKVKLVGSSMGGALALWVAKERPDLVTHVCGISPATHPKLVPPAVDRFYWTSKVLTSLINEITMGQILRRIFLNKSLVNRETIANYLRPYANNPDTIKVFFKSLATLKDDRLPQLFARIPTRMMVLYGLNDRMVPRKKLRLLLDINPRAQYFETKGGHHLMEDNPEWTAEKLHVFFNQ